MWKCMRFNLVPINRNRNSYIQKVYFTTGGALHLSTEKKFIEKKFVVTYLICYDILKVF